MKRFFKMLSVFAFTVLLLNGCNKSCSKAEKDNAPSTTKPQSNKPNEKDKLMEDFDLKPNDKLYAEFDTSMGKMTAELFWEKAPKTVLNFAQLATGKKEWINPNTSEKSNKPLYDNTIFHRVIKGFMIQGGDPAGTGMGGPGYRFKDEFHPDLRHDQKGILSMANAGPNTNGSQFFITEGPTPHLDNRHSVFGLLSDKESMDVLSKIAGVDTDVRDKPVNNIVINNIKIYTK